MDLVFRSVKVDQVTPTCKTLIVCQKREKKYPVCKILDTCQLQSFVAHIDQLMQDVKAGIRDVLLGLRDEGESVLASRV